MNVAETEIPRQHRGTFMTTENPKRIIFVGSGEKKLTDFIPKIMCHSIGKKKGIYKKQ